ncbi:sensor histidine kinase KdpD [Flavobacterium sp. 5]|uniref:sensor histidine kinase n=1 Tax=Flavobacterium sp. 5 TaxID=2035199 RepID=UPI001E5DF31F|nr:HAMP domain-containing sensor histidine kinase [Flavobacterium sp. 5]
MSQISFLKNSYTYKFLFVAFIGIHIPLIGLLLFVLYNSNSVSTLSILFFALLMTLLATASTLLILKKLIKPIEVASKALSIYRNNRIVSDLPINFHDEAGLLMRNIQESIEENEIFINEKQDLIYMLSHDLRTFGGNAETLSKLILEENISDPVKDYAELISDSMYQQNQFIESIIKLLKEQDEIANSNFQPKIIQMRPLFSLVNKQVSKKMSVKNIELILSIEVNEILLTISEDLLVRVLVNLIDNAIKFSFTGSQIYARIYLENEKLNIMISDKGVGFDPKDSELLFEKFTKKSKVGTLNEPSTGIGLYLCRKTIERHQGKLIAQSEGINKGAIFLIVF